LRNDAGNVTYLEILDLVVCYKSIRWTAWRKYMGWKWRGKGSEFWFTIPSQI